MWVSLFIALLTYLMSPKGTSEERRKALLNAAVAGGAAYAVTEYTDWGSDISDKFDGLIGVKPDVTLTPDQIAAQTAENAAGIKVGGGVSAPSSWWDSVKEWSPAILGAGVAAGVSGFPIMPLLFGAGAILLLR